MVINVKVIPGAKKQEVQQENNDFSKTSVKIIKGAYSRNKLVEID